MMFSIENVKTILTFMSMHLGFASLYDAIIYFAIIEVHAMNTGEK